MVMMYDDTAPTRMAFSLHQQQHYHHQLPQQAQLWDWKVEPASPPALPDLDSNNWFNPDDSDYVLAAPVSDLIVPDTVEVEVDAKPPTRAEAAQKLLNDLDEWIKEEPFSDWYEEKIDLPIFEELETVQPPVITRRDVPSVLCAGGLMGRSSCDNHSNHIDAKMGHLKMQIHNPHPVPITIMSQSAPVVNPMPLEHAPPSLMQEFDFVLDSQDTLTPPESPREDPIGMNMLQDMPTEELDELVRIRVESLVEGPDSSRCSSTSYQEESDASSPASMDSGYEDPDPEWSPEPDCEVKPGKRRRQNKPYSRPPPEEKRQRKKEQNKNAATRYRLKKKAEVEEILGEERELEDKNHKLKTDVSELAREIKYLKSLMRDVFKAKGLIK